MRESVGRAAVSSLALELCGTTVLWIMFTIIVRGVTAVRLDLDLPRHGLIRPKTALYERLRDSLRDDPP